MKTIIYIIMIVVSLFIYLFNIHKIYKKLGLNNYNLIRYNLCGLIVATVIWATTIMLIG
jgi:hypothetical protein